MYNRHAKNTVRYYTLLLALLAFLFFSNDFGLLDVQKTAIVVAAGIDRDEEGFVLTTQIAIPQSSTQGKATQSVQITSKGKTIADAFEEVNAKTGWYPKLVFCKLILLGESACQTDVFDALDYFLRDEYLTDNSLVATCSGSAKELLNAAALVDSSSSAAIEKILSSHAERVGSVLPSTLKSFAIGYFSDAASGTLPIVKMESKEEEAQPPQTNDSNDEKGSGVGKAQEKPVFSAGETALFVRGKKVGTLTSEETFACNAVLGSLRLAPYSVPISEGVCTLSIRQNGPKRKLSVGKNGKATLSIAVTLTSGARDFSLSQPLDKISDVGDVPIGAFSGAERKLAGEIKTAFDKSKALGCDLFGVRDLFSKRGKRALQTHGDTLLSNTTADVSVRFEGVR